MAAHRAARSGEGEIRRYGRGEQHRYRSGFLFGGFRHHALPRGVFAPRFWRRSHRVGEASRFESSSQSVWHHHRLPRWQNELVFRFTSEPEIALRNLYQQRTRAVGGFALSHPCPSYGQSHHRLEYGRPWRALECVSPSRCVGLVRQYERRGGHHQISRPLGYAPRFRQLCAAQAIVGGA